MIADALVLFGVIFMLLGFLLRFAGNNAVLAGSDKCKVNDMAKLNKWAGNRFLLLPVIAFGFAPFSTANAEVGIVGLLLLLFAMFGVIIWISIGAKRLAQV